MCQLRGKHAQYLQKIECKRKIYTHYLLCEKRKFAKLQICNLTPVEIDIMDQNALNEFISKCHSSL